MDKTEMYNTDNINIVLVSRIKRFLEYWTMQPGFADSFMNDPEKALTDIGLSDLIEMAGIEALKIIAVKENAMAVKDKRWEELPEPVREYRSFIKIKTGHRDYLKKEGCVPSDHAFAAWRSRQVNRCWAELGSRNDAIIHTPLSFELCKGCSVGCPFCGIAAGGLKSVFRGTEENLSLWREVLTACRDVIGEAAGSGTCYYACEPFDNPEYEAFSTIYYEVMGVVPQITTAASMRKPDRTKAALKLLASQQRHIHRFSVLSLDIFHQIMDYFTPEELVDVELLPQFAEAPNCLFAEVGRAREYDCSKVKKGEFGGDTIACISGFVVNMAEKSLRLITPCCSDELHPTGEIFVAQESFTDAADFADKLKLLISKYMMREFPKTQVLRLREGIVLEKTDEGLLFYRDNGFKLRFTKNDDLPAEYYHNVYEYLKEQKYSAYDIAGELMDNKISPAQVFFILQRFIHAGLCLEPYEMTD